MSVISRILEFIEYKKTNKSRFYKETGLSNGFLDKVKDIGASKIESILYTYPEINLNWLITGKGKMINSNNDADTIELLNDLLERKDELLQNETFRDYIRMNMEFIMADDEREKKNKALDDLRKIAIEKHMNKEDNS